MIKLGVSVQGAQTAYVGTASGDRQAKAALMIQCAARGYLSRQELDRLAENRKVEGEEQKQELLDSLQIYQIHERASAAMKIQSAAMKIQSQWRGHLARIVMTQVRLKRKRSILRKKLFADVEAALGQQCNAQDGATMD